MALSYFVEFLSQHSPERAPRSNLRKDIIHVNILFGNRSVILLNLLLDLFLPCKTRKGYFGKCTVFIKESTLPSYKTIE